MNATARAQRPAKSPQQPRTPRVVELLRKAQEWRRQLDAGEVPSQAEIARREGFTRAQVTQVMGLLRLAPEIWRQILAMPDTVRRPAITERALRSFVHLDAREQAEALEALTANT